VYKGKHKQGGPDRDNPTMWKTRLRCALNKSTDFQEVPHLNQLDISEPYKVYRIEATPRNSELEHTPKQGMSCNTVSLVH